MIKIKNNRVDGSLFHYAHFICDCLFPEIICDIFNYDEVIREKIFIVQLETLAKFILML